MALEHEQARPLLEKMGVKVHVVNALWMPEAGESSEDGWHGRFALALCAPVRRAGGTGWRLERA